jgi:uncharacterized membrane protein
MAMAEREQVHRHKREDRDQSISLWTRSLFAVMALAILGVALAMVLKGQSIIGLGTLAAELVAFGGIYIWGYRQDSGAPAKAERAADAPVARPAPAPQRALERPPEP